MSQSVIGIDKTLIGLATAVAAFRLGTVASFDDPVLGTQEFVFGRADGAITDRGFVCVEGQNGDFTMASVTSTSPGVSGPGSRVGVAQVALADNQYGWFQIYGRGPVRTLASAARGTRLNTTATAGALDDDGTAGSEQIFGIVLTTATGGAAATNENGVLNYPVVGVTL